MVHFTDGYRSQWLYAGPSCIANFIDRKLDSIYIRDHFDESCILPDRILSIHSVNDRMLTTFGTIIHERYPSYSTFEEYHPAYELVGMALINHGYPIPSCSIQYSPVSVRCSVAPQQS